MADKLTPIPVRSLPGVKRDGTVFEGGQYVDGLWCRFQRGMPRKMGGFRELSRAIPGAGRGMWIDSRDGLSTVHIGHQDGLARIQISNSSETPTGVISRTPAGFAANADNIWQFTAIGKTGTATTYIVGHAVPTAQEIDNESATRIAYYGALRGTAALTAIPAGGEYPATGVSGGVVALAPYLFHYGENGVTIWSDPTDPLVYTASTGGGAARITSTKIVKALPYRAGPGNAPAGLFWALDSLLYASFVGSTAVFNFSTISSQSSILSSSCVIEYDGTFYWIGTDRFMMFNGIVRDLPNPMSSNWFFDNLNYQYRQRVFAFKVPRFGEIWWCYPRGTATECTHAIIWNVREQCWYDTELPNGGRSCGDYAQVFPYPMLTGVEDHGSGLYSLWQHEKGVDEISGAPVQTNAVPSYFETADVSLIAPDAGSQPTDRGIYIERIEPDFVQAGDMTLELTGRINAKAPTVTTTPQSFVATATGPAQEAIWLRQQYRELRFKFSSNVAGGDYQLGQTIAFVAPGDGRSQS